MRSDLIPVPRVASVTTTTGTDKPLRAGAYASVPVLPELSTRDLARLDAVGPVAFGRRRSRSVARRLKKAEKKAGTAVEKWRRDLDRQERKTLKESKPKKDRREITTTRSLKTLFGVGTGFAGFDRLMVPWHSTSTKRAGILTPFLVSGSPVFKGPVLGIEQLSGVPFRYDAWSPYQAGMATSVNGMVAGLMGTGKSMFLKVFALRELTWGRKILIEGDPKSEWARVAQAVGGSVISAGLGAFMNPLDAGVKPVSVSEEQWAQTVTSLRISALRGLATAIRPLIPLSMSEETVIAAAVKTLGTREEEPTITDLVHLLASSWVEEVRLKGLNSSQVANTASSLLLVFNTLVEGPLSGAFEKKSTVRIDPNSPLIVFNTGVVDDQDEVRKAVFTAAMSAAIDRVCESRDGVFRIVIGEEGWWILRNPVLVEGWEKRMRLSGEFGVSNWLLVHELSDLEKYANQGTGLRNTIEGILTKSTTKVLYQQSASSLESLKTLLPDLSEDELSVIADLPVGVGLWRVGSSVHTLVRPLMSEQAFRLFDTSAGRAG